MDWLPGDQQDVLKICCTLVGMVHLACLVDSSLLVVRAWDTIGWDFRISGLLSILISGTVGLGILNGVWNSSPLSLKTALIVLFVEILDIVTFPEYAISFSFVVMVRVGYQMNYMSLGPPLAYEFFTLWTIYIVNVYCKQQGIHF